MRNRRARCELLARAWRPRTLTQRDATEPGILEWGAGSGNSSSLQTTCASLYAAPCGGRALVGLFRATAVATRLAWFRATVGNATDACRADSTDLSSGGKGRSCPKTRPAAVCAAWVGTATASSARNDQDRET